MVRITVGLAITVSDADITTSSELLLRSASHPPTPVLADPPVVGGKVAPLEHALDTGQVVWQPQVDLEHLVASTWIVPGPLAIGLLQQVPVQAGLAGGHKRIVLRTEAELEISHVVGRQLYLYFKVLVDLVDPSYGSPSIVASTFIVSRLKMGKIIFLFN